MTKIGAASPAAQALASPGLWAGQDPPFLPCLTGLEMLAAYIDLLVKWNSRLNLIGHGDALAIMRDLAQDSFYLLPFLNSLPVLRDCSDPYLVDLGAGAGLPGIPLRIFWEKGRYTMLETRQQRALFLENAIARLRLKNTIALGESVEHYFASHSTPHIQCVLSRAFRPWPEILKLALPYLAPAGVVVIMANEPCQKLPDGWNLVAETSYNLPHTRRWLWAASPDYAN